MRPKYRQRVQTVIARDAEENAYYEEQLRLIRMNTYAAPSYAFEMLPDPYDGYLNLSTNRFYVQNSVPLSRFWSWTATKQFIRLAFALAALKIGCAHPDCHDLLVYGPAGGAHCVESA